MNALLWISWEPFIIFDLFIIISHHCTCTETCPGIPAYNHTSQTEHLSIIYFICFLQWFLYQSYLLYISEQVFKTITNIDESLLTELTQGDISFLGVFNFFIIHHYQNVTCENGCLYSCHSKMLIVFHVTNLFFKIYFDDTWKSGFFCIHPNKRSIDVCIHSDLK